MLGLTPTWEIAMGTFPKLGWNRGGAISTKKPAISLSETVHHRTKVTVHHYYMATKMKVSVVCKSIKFVRIFAGVP